MNGREARSVVLLIHSLDVGGAQRSVITTAAAWPSSWNCEIVSARGGPLLADARRAAKTRVVAETWPGLLGIARFMLELRSIAHEERPSAFLSNSFGVTRIVLLLKKLRWTGRSAIIVIEHSTLSVKMAGLYGNGLLQRLAIRLTRWLYRSADAIIGVSDGVARDLEQALDLPEGVITTIHNPIDVARIEAAVNAQVPVDLEVAFRFLQRPVVLTAGRMVSAKSQVDLLKAFALLPDRIRGSLVILGDGPLRQELEQEAKRLGIRDRVWMPGFVENPWWFVARAEVFALTSRLEGFPLVLAEALACKTPVISTDCPSGPRELLENASSARLVPMGDAKLFAAAVEDLLNAVPECFGSSVLSSYAPVVVAVRYAELVERVISPDMLC